MQKEKLPDSLSTMLMSFVKLKARTREISNETNREKTKLKKVFKDAIAKKEWGVGTYIVHEGTRFDYSVSEGSTVPPEAFLKLYEDKTITKEQFLACISVTATKVATLVGGDIALRVTERKVGNTFDVRLSELDIDSKEIGQSFVAIESPDGVQRRVARKPGTKIEPVTGRVVVGNTSVLKVRPKPVAKVKPRK